MKVDDKTQEKINLISLYEQNISALMQQKQNFQTQLMENESAALELEKTNTAYKIIGNIMVLSDVDALKKQIESKKEMFEIRLKSIEKQEEKLKQKISEIQKEVMSDIKK